MRDGLSRPLEAPVQIPLAAMNGHGVSNRHPTCRDPRRGRSRMVAVTRLTGALITVFEEQCHDDASRIASIRGHAGGRWERPAL
jgi:hypothetical protein